VASPCEGDPSFPHAPTSSSDPLRFDRSLFSGPLRHGLLGRRSGVPRAFVPLHGDQLRVHRWRQLHEHLRRELQLRLRHQQHLRRRLRRLLQHRLRDGQRLQHHHRRELERPLRGPDELHGLRRCFEQRPVPGRRGLRCHLHRCVQPRLHRSELHPPLRRGGRQDRERRHRDLPLIGQLRRLAAERPSLSRAKRPFRYGHSAASTPAGNCVGSLRNALRSHGRSARFATGIPQRALRQGIASARWGTPFALTGEAPVSLRAFRSEHSGRELRRLAAERPSLSRAKRPFRYRHSPASTPAGSGRQFGRPRFAWYTPLPWMRRAVSSS
jgi:hypothetical protein